MILVCTLGTSWAVVAEAYSYLAFDACPLFSSHPSLPRFREDRLAHGLAPPTWLWVVTTDGPETDGPLASLREWLGRLPAPPRLRVFRALGSPEAGDEAECSLLRELILRVVLHASEKDPAVVLSLAGGRKTMSADLQAAGNVFGCRALLHVLVPTPPPEALGKPSPADLLRPLSPDLARHVTPVVVGRGTRADFLDVSREATGPVRAAGFPLPGPDARGFVRFRPVAGEALLSREVEERQRQASVLLGNYLQRLSAEERHENWRSLYRLRPSEIERLRRTVVDETQRPFLLSMPKADLHHHLGGCLPVAAQQAVGRAVWEALAASGRAKAIDSVAHLLEPERDWPLGWNAALREPALTPEDRTARAAALLVHLDAVTLESRLYGPTQPRRALRDRRDGGFRLYELPGELSGSALLGHPAAVREYARQCLLGAVAHGTRYLELRGSPTKYLGGDGLGFLRLFQGALRNAAAEGNGATCDVRFLVIADRRQRVWIAPAVDLALRAREELGDFVVGVDLAGDEKRGSPRNLASDFKRAFAACLAVTIHAGEGEDAANIWEAAYHLHADRIGHGLTLADKPELARRFRDRRICLELCPTSNLEVVGFRDPADPSTSGSRLYPLPKLLELGLPVTLCTDNSGTSRTDLAEEYVVASRLSGGISLWDALAIAKQGFLAAFLPADERERLLKEADVTLFRLLSTGDGR